jgi:hypothetical protein
LETLDFAPAAASLPLTQVYFWPRLEDGVCPNEMFGDTDVHVGLSADPPGSTYGFVQSDVFWLWDELSSFVELGDLADLTTIPTTLPELQQRIEDLQDLEQDLVDLLLGLRRFVG